VILHLLGGVSNTMALVNGVYRISQYGTHEQPQILTLDNGDVTVRPPGGAPIGDQEVTLAF
jgi:hypothetical protein